MNTLFTTVFLFSFIASTVFAQSFTINTPASIVECEPSMLTWSGGTPGYFLTVLPGGQPSATPLVSFSETNATSLTWIVNITAGVQVFFNLRDSTGALAQSAPLTVQSSSDSSCINASAVVPVPTNSGTNSAAGTTTPVSGSTGTSTPNVPGTTGGTTEGPGSSSTSTGATTSPSHAAAASHYAPVGTLAMTGVALALALVL